MTFQDDPNRADPVVRTREADPLVRTRATGTGMGWGLPLGIAAVALILGMFFFSGDRSTPATNTSAPNAQSTPSARVGTTNPTPAPVTPAPTPARPGIGG